MQGTESTGIVGKSTRAYTPLTLHSPMPVLCTIESWIHMPGLLQRGGMYLFASVKYICDLRSTEMLPIKPVPMMPT